MAARVRVGTGTGHVRLRTLCPPALTLRQVRVCSQSTQRSHSISGLFFNSMLGSSNRVTNEIRFTREQL